ncbi:hypothetical protein DM01DRAFT_2481 [Hesseltinella vesiculosa]|uniref:Uncharacterized protein n=1 Tax=Hesseltinella vesiculosa TaxID=101127 RepID=A0A1X2GDG5_9FUNG|nr:hypothetical protein DM01DRAFT_2481 [Hesseltinella vesiculosa]
MCSLDHVSAGPDSCEHDETITSVSRMPTITDPSSHTKVTLTVVSKASTAITSTTVHTKSEVLSDEQPGRHIGDSWAYCEIPSITKTATTDRCAYKITTSTKLTTGTAKSTMTTTSTTATIPRASQGQKLHAVFACENCHTAWYRDQNSSRNYPRYIPSQDHGWPQTMGMNKICRKRASPAEPVDSTPKSPTMVNLKLTIQ